MKIYILQFHWQSGKDGMNAYWDKDSAIADFHRVADLGVSVDLSEYTTDGRPELLRASTGRKAKK